MADVIRGHRGIPFRSALLPLFPGHEAQARGLVEPRGHLLGISSERERRSRNHMKALRQSRAAVANRQHKCPRHVFRMDMMYRFHSKIRKRNFVAPH